MPIGSEGRSPPSVGTASSPSTTSMPSVTWPKTVCLPSSQLAGVGRDDEELRAVRVGAGVGHRQRAPDDLVVVELVLEGVAGTAGAGALRAPALDHEVLDDAVEDEPVVEALGGELAEVLDGLGGVLVEQLEDDRPVGGLHVAVDMRLLYPDALEAELLPVARASRRIASITRSASPAGHGQEGEAVEHQHVADGLAVEARRGGDGGDDVGHAEARRAAAAEHQLGVGLVLVLARDLRLGVAARALLDRRRRGLGALLPFATSVPMWRSIACSSRFWRSSTKVIARPERPTRPVRPMRCT